MKFNDGYWLLRNGVKVDYGLQVTNARSLSADTLQLQVATKPIRHRGDTLGGPVLTLDFWVPSNGIIGVKLTHFKGGNAAEPKIPLFPNACPEASEVNCVLGEFPSLSSGPLRVSISRNPYSFSFSTEGRDGLSKTITTSHSKAQFIADVPYQLSTFSASSTTCLATDHSTNPGVPPRSVRYISQEFNISPGELFYGFGEQFGVFSKNGQCINIWNRDGGTASEQAYKCVPFYFSTRGYGLFVRHGAEVEFEVGSEKVSRLQIAVRGESLEYYVIHGSTPLEVLSRYTLLTGRPALPPLWSFGLWLSTSFLTDYSFEVVSSFLDGMRARKCDVRVFHMDCFWMKQFEWCSFTFDPDNFPNPAKYLADIKQKYGVKICLWINPYVSQHSPLFDEGLEGGYFIKRTNGDVWQCNLWQPGMAIVDITHPGARDWYAAKLDALLDLGVDSLKTDFGERIPHVDVQYYDKSVDPIAMHNIYAVKYNELVFGLLEKRFGQGEAVVFARSSFAGGQRFPVHWGGDCESTFEAMAETLRGGLSLTLSGFAFTSHDIGGFEGRPAPEIYLRWLAYGLFSSHSRLHGSDSYRVPWEYGEDAAIVLSKFQEMKHRLMPYLYAQAIQAHIHGHPMQRAMLVDFLDDRTTHSLDQQYMLGPNLLFAPVFGDKDFETEYYLPSGTWTALTPLLGQGAPRVEIGPKWIRECVPYSDIPAWVRPNSAILIGPPGKRVPDYELNQNTELRLYQIRDGSTQTIKMPTGLLAEIASEITIQRRDNVIQVEIIGEKFSTPWRIRIFELGTLTACIDGANASTEEDQEFGGLVVQVPAYVQSVTITLG